MRRQAKASSAGSIEGTGSSHLGTLFLFATLALLATLVLGTGTASAAAPTVTIGTVTQVGFATHVEGTVDPSTQETSYHFQFVTQAEFEFSEWAGGGQVGFGTVAANAGSTPVETEFNVPPDGTYRLRLVAENADGSVEAISPTTFTTKASGPPTLTINPSVTSISRGSVVVEGTVDPNGRYTIWSFEYSTDDVNWSGFASQGELNEFAGVQPVSAELTGLLAGTEYFVRLAAVTFAGDAVVSPGPDPTFTTSPAIAPGIDGSPAFASSTPTSVTLNGTVNPNSGATTFHFDYGLSATPYSSKSPEPDGDAGHAAFDTPVSTTITDLQPDTVYHFRVTANDGVGGEQDGADATIATAPAAPGDATSVTSRGATLTGVINPNGAPITYHFDYGTTTAYGNSTAESDGGSGSGDEPVSAPITGLEPGTTYHVQVVATVNGQTVSGADGAFTTGAPPVAVAADPTAVSTSAATLNGSVDTHGLDGTYQFFASSLSGPYVASTNPAPVPSGAGAQHVTQALSDLPAGQTFLVRLSVTSNGSTALSEPITFSTAPLPPITPAAPIAVATAPYGCAAPVLNPYNGHPKPGDTITISGTDLGVGGTVALGEESPLAAGWSASGFSIQIPPSASGTLPLTVNCGTASNTIALAIFKAPSNHFTIAKSAVRGTTATLSVKVPGAGKLTASGEDTLAAKGAAKKAGTAKLAVKLSAAGKRALEKAGGGGLTVTVTVRYTPSGGSSAALTEQLTFNAGGSR